MTKYHQILLKNLAIKTREQADLIVAARNIDALKHVMGANSSNKLQEIENKIKEQTPEITADKLLKTVKLVLLGALTRSLDVESRIVASNQEIRSAYEDARRYIEQKKNSVR